MWVGPKQFGAITSILLCTSLTRLLLLSSEQKCARSFSGISRAAKRTACEVHQRARCPSGENCFPQHAGLLWSPIKSGNSGTQPEREGKWHPLVLLFINYKNIQGGRSKIKAKKHCIKDKSIREKKSRKLQEWISSRKVTVLVDGIISLDSIFHDLLAMKLTVVKATG